MAQNSLTPFRSGGLLGGDPFLSLHREMNRMFEDMWRGAGLTPANEGGPGAVLSPRLNVSETETEIRVTAELPGVSENDIDVDLNDDVLVIRAEKKMERKEEKENFHVVESAYGTFQRALQLPGPVNADQCNASFENGVLTVTVRKSEQQQQSRRIQVQAGGRSARQGENGGPAASGGGENGAASGQGAGTGPGAA